MTKGGGGAFEGSEESPLQRLKRDVRKDNPYWETVVDRYQQPDGCLGTYFFMKTPGSVLVIPELADGRIVMARQFRYIQQRWGLEFPGGGREQGLNGLETAKKELKEETGYIAREWTFLGSFSPCVGLIDEMCELYLARELVEGSASPEPSELITIESLRPKDFERAIQEQQIWNGMTLAAWSMFQLKA